MATIKLKHVERDGHGGIHITGHIGNLGAADMPVYELLHEYIQASQDDRLTPAELLRIGEKAAQLALQHGLPWLPGLLALVT